MNGRPWTEEESVVLRKDYGNRPTKELAVLFNRTARAVHMHANTLNLVRRREPWPPEFEQLIREAQVQGWTDSIVQQKWNAKHDRKVSREWVSEYRRRKLGLPDQRDSADHRRRVAAKTREQCKAAGVKSLAEIQKLTFRRYAEKHGWPTDMPPRCVQMLNVLHDQGPMTRRQIADAIGMPWKGSRKSLVGNVPGGSYLAYLMRKGFVVCIPRSCTGKGSGRSTNVYALSLAVERNAGS